VRYNLFVDDSGYGWEVKGGVVYPLPPHLFPRVLRGGLDITVESYKKIPKEYT